MIVLLTTINVFDFSLNHFKYEGFHLNAQAMFWRKTVHDKFSFLISISYTMDYQMIVEFGLIVGQSNFLYHFLWVHPPLRGTKQPLIVEF